MCGICFQMMLMLRVIKHHLGIIHWSFFWAENRTTMEGSSVSHCQKIGFICFCFILGAGVQHVSTITNSICIIGWAVPPPSNSHHQDHYIFRLGDSYKPSFATNPGRGDNPNYWVLFAIKPKVFCIILNRFG